MILNFPNCQWLGITTFSPGTTFYIPPIKNQIAIGFYSGSTGIEISGAGASYAPLFYTLIGGVTTVLNGMNSNGSSMVQPTNGNGLPIYNTILTPMVLQGGAPIWGTASGKSLLMTVMFFGNDPFPNQ